MKILVYGAGVVGSFNAARLNCATPASDRLCVAVDARARVGEPSA